MADVRQVISALGALSKQDRQKVRRALDFLDGHKSPVIAVTQSHREDWLLPGIVAELRRRGLSYADLPESRLTQLAPNYITDAAAVCADLREKLILSRPSTPRVQHAELLAFGRVCARALADYLQPVAPLGLKLLLTNIAKVPDALEASFPDYLSSGMLWLLVGSRK